MGIQKADINVEIKLDQTVAFSPIITDKAVRYEVGSYVYPDGLDTNKNISCAPGIHFHYERRYAFMWIDEFKDQIQCNYGPIPQIEPRLLTDGLTHREGRGDVID